MRIAQLRAVGGDADAAFRWLARLRERNQTLLLLNLPSPCSTTCATTRAGSACWRSSVARRSSCGR
jgi:hypothetical protein